MRLSSYEMRRTIASRAGIKGKTNRIRAIRVADFRRVPGHIENYVEVDYYFKIDGELYRVNEHLCNGPDGTNRYSAKYRYELIKI